MDAMADPEVETVTLMTSAQVGKGLALSTKIPTPTGWVTMGDVRPGDRLYDENGAPCTVLGISEVKNLPCYRVVFSDGSEVVCDNEHLWAVDKSKNGKDEGQYVLGIQEIARTYKSGNRNNYAVPVAKAIAGSRQSLIIDPYLLGLWLGDDNTNGITISAHADDVDHYCRQITAAGHEVRTRVDKTCTTILVDPGYKRSWTGVGRFCMLLGTLGVRGNKHIPAAYLRAEWADRLALLQGIMDADGSICPTKGRCEITLSNDRLAADVCELLGTLGIKYTANEKVARCVANGQQIDCGMAWRMSFLVYSDVPVFRLPRKLSKMVARGEGVRRSSETDRRRIVSVEAVESVPTRCIKVDSPSSLFLCSEWFIPTHNTSCLINGMGYYIHHAPAPMLAIQPTLEMAEAFSKDKLAPVLRDTPVLRALVAEERSRVSANTIRHKQFPGGQLTIAGANSPTSLRMRSIKIVWADEIDAYPASAGEEGDPLKLARKRSQTYPDSKLIQSSTPTIKGLSRVSDEFERSDKCYLFVPCPDCGHSQHLVWENVHWTKGQPETAGYACENCGTLWSDGDVKRAVRLGEWRATAEFTGHRGFHIWQIYSPWSSLPEIIRDYEDAEGKSNELQVWWNTVLGLPWDGDERAQVTAEQLHARRTVYPAARLPERSAVVTAGVDVQGDRLEVLFQAFGADNESWVMDAMKIYGDPSTDPPWAELQQLLQVRIPHPCGLHLPLEAVAIDSGYLTQRVYDFSARNLSVGRRWYAIKGNPGEGKISWEQSKIRLKNGARLYLVGVDGLKTEIYSRLGQTEPGPNYIHFPEREPFELEWFEQLTVERIRTVYDTRGYGKREWYKPEHARNEALDLMVYSEAAHRSMNINHKERLAQMYRQRPTANAADVARLFM